MAQDARLSALVQERGPALVGYAYLLAGNVSDAEDLVQEGLIRTFSRRRSGADIEWLEAYVRRAILTAFLDGHRKKRRWLRSVHLFEGPTSHESPDAAAHQRIDVHAALAGLPPRMRACVVLRHYQDLSVREVAERLGIHEGTVKRHLSDARERLGPLLAADDDDHVPVRTTTTARTSTSTSTRRQP